MVYDMQAIMSAAGYQLCFRTALGIAVSTFVEYSFPFVVSNDVADEARFIPATPSLSEGRLPRSRWQWQAATGLHLLLLRLSTWRIGAEEVDNSTNGGPADEPPQKESTSQGRWGAAADQKSLACQPAAVGKLTRR
jgi:hypothetical protein